MLALKEHLIIVSPLSPRTNTSLIGHGAAEEAFFGAIRAGRLSHAWLLAGPQGIGKATMAFKMARHLFRGAPVDGGPASDPQDLVFRQVASGGHVDLLVLGETVTDEEETGSTPLTVGVDDARRVAPFLGLTSGTGGWRVVIVDRAETLSRNAANALLKVVEEPPRRSLLILVCTVAGKLPPALRSRCRRLDLSPLPFSEVASILENVAPELNRSATEKVAALAQGSPGYALRLYKTNGVDLFYGILETLVPSDAGQTAVVDDLARRAATDAEHFAVFSELINQVLARICRARSGVAEIPQWPGDPVASHITGISAGASLDRWLSVWDKACGSLAAAARSSLDRQLSARRALKILSDVASP